MASVTESPGDTLSSESKQTQELDPLVWVAQSEPPALMELLVVAVLVWAAQSERPASDASWAMFSSVASTTVTTPIMPLLGLPCNVQEYWDKYSRFFES